MANSWQTITLEEFAQHQKGFAFKSKDYVEKGIAVVRVSNLTTNSIDISDLKYVSEEVASDKRNFKLTQNDIVIATVGSWPKNPASVVGKVIKVPKNCDNFLLNQNAVRFRVKSEDPYDQLFLYYLLKSKTFSDYIISTAQGSANQASITLKDIYAFEFKCPSASERKEIANILSAIDDKTSLNSHTNQTLEQMAQALFKSWFVDFDPVIDNALAAGNDIPEALQHKAEKVKQAQQLSDFKPLPDDIRALFPSEFEQTGDPTIGLAGWIPKGWKYSELSEFMNVKHGFAYKGEYFSDEPTNDILLTPGNVAIGGGFKGDKFKFYNGPIMDDYIFTEGDLYITMTDLSKAGDTLGYPAIVPCIEGLTFHHNQRLGKVDFKDINRFGPEFLYRCLCSRNYRSYIIASATGTTVKHTSPTKILQHKVITSGGLVEPIFEQYVKHFSAKKELNNMNSIDLAKTRDVLLPKLISGEITINKEVV